MIIDMDTPLGKRTNTQRSLGSAFCN